MIKFESCSTLEDKVRLFWENPAIQEVLKDRVKVGICRKDEEAAKEKKDVGNKLFSKGRDTEALKNYNKALVLAPVDSLIIPIILANRSAVFYKLGRLEECLEDVQEALKLDYPIHLRHKVLERRTRALNALNRNDEV